MKGCINRGYGVIEMIEQRLSSNRLEDGIVGVALIGCVERVC